MPDSKMRIRLAEPDWAALLGGADEAKWIADRDRKHGRALDVSKWLISTFDALSERGALFKPTPEILIEIPHAADWYVSLAGFAMKTLGNIKEAPKSFGMTQAAKTFVARLVRGSNDLLNNETARRGRNERVNLEAFCCWISSEIDTKFPLEDRDPEHAFALVSLILGGRIIGQGQNEGGNDGVVLVKDLLVRALATKHRTEVCASSGSAWQTLSDAPNLTAACQVRFGGDLVCDFTSGGNRPDIKILLCGEVIAIGEIKARKDLSNVWESWMPQVVGHMKTWSGEFPDAARLFFGTLINVSMIEGESRKGTKHTGLRELFESGQLTSAFNISKTVIRDQAAETAWSNLADELSKLLIAAQRRG